MLGGIFYKRHIHDKTPLKLLTTFELYSNSFEQQMIEVLFGNLTRHTCIK